MLNIFLRALNSKKGFTLIEVLVVVAIIAILSAIAVPMILGRMTQARESQEKALAKTLQNALAMYMTDKDANPEMDEIVFTNTGYPENLSDIWEEYGTKYFDLKTIEILKANTEGNKITGHVLVIEYDNTNGVISTSKIE